MDAQRERVRERESTTTKSIFHGGHFGFLLTVFGAATKQMLVKMKHPYMKTFAGGCLIWTASENIFLLAYLIFTGGGGRQQKSGFVGGR